MALALSLAGAWALSGQGTAHASTHCVYDPARVHSCTKQSCRDLCGVVSLSVPCPCTIIYGIVMHYVPPGCLRLRVTWCRAQAAGACALSAVGRLAHAPAVFMLAVARRVASHWFCSRSVSPLHFGPPLVCHGPGAAHALRSLCSPIVRFDSRMLLINSTIRYSL